MQSIFFNRNQSPAKLSVDVDPSDFYLEVGNVVMKRILLLIGLGIVSWWLYAYLSNNRKTDLIGELLICLILLLCWHETYHQRLKSAIFILCWGLWITTIHRGFFVAGINTPILLSIPPIIMFVVWIQGPRVAALIVTLTFLILGSIVYLQTNGRLPPPLYRSPVQLLIIYFEVIGISAAIAMALGQNLKRLIQHDRAVTLDLQAKLLELSEATVALNVLNEQLELKVHERTRQYEQANADLTQVHAQLERAQLALVKTETLSSMASMVAGISHELNTPVGNALLISSRLGQDFQSMLQSFESENIKRSELKLFLDSGKSACEIAVDSNQRAADLINNFKQVSIDQISEQRGRFDLSDLISNSIHSYRESHQHSEMEIVNCTATGIEVDSFPRALGLIIDCLLQNAIIHGFESKRKGTVIFYGKVTGNDVEVTVSDNGVGMGPVVLAHAFDPFFTTHFGKGRVGLGLSVSYRIATSILRGNLAATSSPNVGSTFVLSFPLRVPVAL